MPAVPGPPPDPVAEASARVRRALMGRTPLRRFLGAVCRAVDAAGGSVWLVGGFVRDLALGRPGKDIDLMVAGIPFARLGALLRALPRASLGIRRVAPVGKQFPVYKIGTEWSGEDVDVALARGEGWGVARGDRPPRPPARPADAARDDASHRDFTVNSLLFALRPKGAGFAGEIVDYFGGVADLRRRVLRAVGDPDERFREDPVRVLRAVRFRNEWPGYAIARRTRNAIRRAALSLPSVPGDRLAGELVRSLAADPPGTVEDLRRLGILRLMLPELGAGAGLAAARMKRRYLLLGKALGRPLPPPLLLAAFLVDAAETERNGFARGGRPVRSPPLPERGSWRLTRTESAARRLHLPQVRSIVRMVEDLWRLEEARRAANPRARIERIFARWPEPEQLVALYEATLRAAGRRTEDFRPLLWRAVRRPPLLSGADVLRMGVPEGPGVDRILEAVREAELAGRVRTREGAVRMARNLLARGRKAAQDRGG